MLNIKFQGHFERVSLYSYLIALEISLPLKDVKKITLAAYLHDVGKLLIDDQILNKTEPLSEQDWDKIMQHPNSSSLILSNFGVEHEILELILYHHERMDGNGYPGGLTEDDIPLGVRVISVADVYDSMTSDRPYRAPLERTKAIMELERYSGGQFDPMVVKVFTRLIQKHPALFQMS